MDGMSCVSVLMLNVDVDKIIRDALHFEIQNKKFKFGDGRSGRNYYKAQKRYPNRK